MCASLCNLSNSLNWSYYMLSTTGHTWLAFCRVKILCRTVLITLWEDCNKKCLNTGTLHEILMFCACSLIEKQINLELKIGWMPTRFKIQNTVPHRPVVSFIWHFKLYDPLYVVQNNTIAHISCRPQWLIKSAMCKQVID